MKHFEKFVNAPQAGSKLDSSINFTANMLAGISGGVGSSGDTGPRPQAATSLADDNNETLLSATSN